MSAALPSRRAALRAAGAGAAVLALGACARIPVSGPVRTDPLSGAGEADVPYLQPRPPAEDASPVQIVSGFVLAATGPEDDYRVARAHLAPQARTAWDPAASVLQYDAGEELEITELEGGAVRLVLHAVGRLDGTGVLTRFASPQQHEIILHGVETDEGWRLADPPPGILLSDTAFSTFFSAAKLYFLDPRRLHLVPDLRWFPAQSADAAARAALAAGPSPLLAPAVVTAVPSAADVAAGVITASGDGVSTLELPASIAALALPDRELAVAQLQYSLRSMSQTADLRLEQAGAAVALAQDSGLSRPLPGHRPIGAGSAGVISLADIASREEPPQLVPDLAGEAVLAPVISQSTALVAALRPDRGAIILTSVDGSLPRRDVVGTGFLPPVVDDAGYAWTSTEGSSGALVALSVLGADGDARIDAPWLAGRTIQALDLSADATRMLVLSRDGTGSRLDLCAAVRGADGVPSALGEPIALASDLADVILARWFDETAVLVLGSESGSERVSVMELQAGSDRLPAPPPGTEWIAGTAISDEVWASTADGRLHRLIGASWGEVPITASHPSFY